MEEWDNSGHLEGENAQLTAFLGGGMRRYLRFLRGEMRRWLRFLGGGNKRGLTLGLVHKKPHC